MSFTKQKLLCGVIPVLLLILAVSPVCFAEGEVNAFPHLRLGAGARSIGLGGAFTAIAEDATATVWNPAGLGSTTDLNLNLSTQHISDQGILGQSQHFIALTKTLGTYGAVGIAATHFGVADIERRDNNENYLGTTDFMQNAFSLSYGVAIGHFNVGLTGRMLMDNNFGVDDGESQSGFGGVDIGLMGHALHIDIGERMMGHALHAHSDEGAAEGHLHVPTFHYGIVAKYLGASIGEATVPMVVNAGVAYDLYMGNVVTFSADIEHEFVNLDESPFSMRAGVEYTILTNKSTAFSLRTGVRASRDVQDIFGGFGVNIAGLQVDYAIQDGMNPINQVGIRHYLSVSYGY